MHDKKEWMIVYLSLPTNHKSKPLAYIYNLSSLSSSFTLFFIAAATTPQSITCRSF